MNRICLFVFFVLIVTSAVYAEVNVEKIVGDGGNYTFVSDTDEVVAGDVYTGSTTEKWFDANRVYRWGPFTIPKDCRVSSAEFKSGADASWAQGRILILDSGSDFLAETDEIDGLLNDT
ncbi:MAG: hypothetical protein CUN57_00390, partial [Phototrophicales bacterium]